MTDRLQLPRLLDIYAANWTLLLEARELRLVDMLQNDFDAIREAQRVEFPRATAEMTDLLVAHEALVARVIAGATGTRLSAAQQAHTLAIRALRALPGSAVG